MMNLNDEFEAKIKTNLDTQVQGLDADTRHQLAVARTKALNQPSKYSWRDSGLSSTWLKSAWLKSASRVVAPRQLRHTPHKGQLSHFRLSLRFRHWGEGPKS